MNEKENRPRERTVTREDGTVERYPVIERKVTEGRKMEEGELPA